MSINYRQAPTLGYTSHPDYSAAGAFTFTFNAGATDAQVAADPSLFNNWGDLVNEAGGRDGPVTVYFPEQLHGHGHRRLSGRLLVHRCPLSIPHLHR